jgi:hypothetical protein
VEEVIAMARLCLSLCPDVTTLADWGRDHAKALASLPDPTKSTIRAAYADRLAVLKETQS